jgi:hypothetical protein
LFINSKQLTPGGGGPYEITAPNALFFQKRFGLEIVTGNLKIRGQNIKFVSEIASNPKIQARNYAYLQVITGNKN